MSVTEPSTTTKYELTDPDVRLMLQVRDDNGAAFEELVLRYQGRLITVLEHMVGRQGNAEDLAQEIFLRVYRARKRYTPGAKFSTWLFTIANNVARNALRSKSRRKEVQAPASESGSYSAQTLEQMAIEASGAMPTRQLDNAEMMEIVQLALETLNERQRMAMLLSKFEGMSYADIADAMEMTTQAVKSLLSRARGNLKTILDPYIQDGVKPVPFENTDPVDAGSADD